MQHRELYDRAQRLDRETDALRFKINGVADPAERASLQVQIDRATQRASDAWADFHDAEDVHRRCTASVSRPAALAPPASSQPVLTAAEIAARRRAETSAFWKRVIARVNAETLGGEPDSSPDGAVTPGGGQKSSTTSPSTRAIWSKAISAANRRFEQAGE